MLRFFKADPSHFDLIFVANTTAAIKLVVDSFQACNSRAGFWYGYHSDSHTSLVGARELAIAGSRCFYSDADVEEWIDTDVEPQLEGRDCGTGPSSRLFAYPAQSNMNGRRLPLDWPGRLRRSTKSHHDNLYTLLDVAAFASTAQVDLSDSDNAPDFTALSFYKIFGYPDLGALIVRKEAGHVLLNRSYFGGGTVDMVINSDGKEWVARKQSSIHEALEDGTPAFHNIISLESALIVHHKLYGSMEKVSRHTTQVALAMYRQLIALSHSDGSPVCIIYTDASPGYGNSSLQGPTIAFNVRDSRGNWIGKSDFERLAILNGIQLRTGGLCNPGGIASCLRIDAKEMRDNYNEGLRCGNGLDEMNGKPTGVVRISFGAMSSNEDVKSFMRFLNLFVDRVKSNQAIGLVSSARQARIEKPPGKQDQQDGALLYSGREFKSNEGNKSRMDFGAINLRCPVAHCNKIFESQQTLQSHFRVHGSLGLHFSFGGSLYKLFTVHVKWRRAANNSRTP